VIGIAAAVLPSLWTAIFSRQPDVVAAGNDYLRIVAPYYPVYGAGMALYFASQGAGRVTWPLIASFVRLAMVAAGGWWWVTVRHGSLDGFFAVIAASYAALGAINLAAFATGASWKRAAA
jgi:Na+-driven multidrug efflux pump